MIRRKLSRSDKISINIFSEDILSRWLPQADYNILIPNQEWSRPKTQNLLGRVDSVFCKTRYAESIYRKYAKIAFIGFSSKDCYNPAVQKDYNRYLHVAGQSLEGHGHPRSSMVCASRMANTEYSDEVALEPETF